VKTCTSLITLATTTFLSLIFVGYNARCEQLDIVNAAVLSLTNINSPRANGMGGCVANLVDEQSGYYNPGALGLFHLKRIAAFSAPNNTRWLPELSDDFRLKTWSASLGGSYQLLTRSTGKRFNISLGLAYSRMKMEWGTFSRTFETPEPIGTIETYDKVNTYSLGVAVEYYARLGVGYSIKKIHSQFSVPGAGTETGVGTTEGDAHDYGIILQLPIHSFFKEGMVVGRDSEVRWNLEFTPSIAYVKSNIGEDIYYIDLYQADPLPKTSRTGISLTGAIARKRGRCFLLAVHGKRKNYCWIMSPKPKGAELSLDS